MLTLSYLVEITILFNTISDVSMFLLVRGVYRLSMLVLVARGSILPGRVGPAGEQMAVSRRSQVGRRHTLPGKHPPTG